MDPSFSVRVTCISKQYFVLGWLDGSLLAGDNKVSEKGRCHLPQIPISPLHFELALLPGHLPECWLQTPP